MPQEHRQNLINCTVCDKQFPENELVRYQKDLVCVDCKSSYFQRIREGVAAPGSKAQQYSSVGRRFVALMLDGVILFMVQMILNLIFVGSLLGAGMRNHAMSGAALGGTLIVGVLSLFIGVAYFVFFLGWKGATPGKMALKIKVVKPDGQPISYGQAFLRYIGTIVSGIIIFIGYIMAIFDDEKRALHDRIASTRVIHH